MNITEIIVNQLQKTHSPFSIENGVRLNTHCLYPSNAMVQVAIMGQGATCFVTDDGGAYKEAERAGASLKNHDNKYKKILERQGLFMQHGVIFSPQIPVESVSAGILLVANASKEIADLIYEHFKFTKNRNFKMLVRELLEKQFSSSSIVEEKIVGTSNKPHNFENVVHFLDGSKLIVDAVLRDANSINSRVVANIDVKSANYPKTRQRIVYDDTDNWQSADLSLLNVSGVPVVPFTKSGYVLHQAMAA